VNRKADFYKTNQDSLIQRTDSNGSKEYNMTYTLFFIADYQFQEVFYVSLGNIFTVFVQAV